MKRKRNNRPIRLFYILLVTLVFLYFIMVLRIHHHHHGTYQQQQNRSDLQRKKIQLPNITWKESRKIQPKDGRSNIEQQQQQRFTTKRQQENQSSKKESSITYNEWAIPSTNYHIDTDDLWEQKEQTAINVPLWMKQYFRWHKEIRLKYFSSTITSIAVSDKNDDWNKMVPFDILHVTCLSKYTMKCGGVADRLLSLPFIVLVAAQSKRYIIIEWDKPSSLENFLLPPVGGIDWRIPKSFHSTNATASFTKYLRKNGYRAGTELDIVTSSMNRQLRIVQMKFQSHDHGSNYYNTYVQSHDSIPEEPNFDLIFGTVWNYFFVPVQRIQEKLQQIMYTNQLYPGQYRGIHLRALYTQQLPTNEMITKWTINSINCAYYMTPITLPNGTTIISIPKNDREIMDTPYRTLYFASDSSYAIEQAIRYDINTMETRKTPIRIVISNTSTTSSSMNTNPLHLDKAKNWKSRTVDEYDPLFIDLYLLGMSDCVAYGMGGYGKLASLLRIIPRTTNENVSDSSYICSIIHMTAMSLTECPWIPTASKEAISGTPKNQDSSSSFVDISSKSQIQQQSLLLSEQGISTLFNEMFPKPMP